MVGTAVMLVFTVLPLPALTCAANWFNCVWTDCIWVISCVTTFCNDWISVSKALFATTDAAGGVTVVAALVTVTVSVLQPPDEAQTVSVSEPAVDP